MPISRRPKEAKRKIKLNKRLKLDPVPVTAGIGFFHYFCSKFLKMKNYSAPEILEQEIVETVTKDEAVKALILYNDDFNTFDFW